MPAILDIPEVRARVSRLTVEEYHRLDEFNENGRRTELIRGILIEKRSKSPLHSAIGKRLYDLLLPLLPSRFVVRRKDPLTFLDSEPEPDIAVVRGTLGDFLRKHPSTADLVVEVAVSNPALDRENAFLYAEANVTEYWIVLAETRQVEAYRNPVNGAYQTKLLFGVGDRLECASVPGLSISLSEIFLQ